MQQSKQAAKRRLPGNRGFWAWAMFLSTGLGCFAETSLDAQEQLPVLGIDEMLERGVKQSDRVQILNERMQKGLAEVDQSRAEVWPKVSFGAQWTHRVQPPTMFPDRRVGNEIQYGINLSSPLYSFGRTRHLLKLAESQDSYTRVSRKVDLQGFMRNLLQAYTRAFRAKAAHTVALKGEAAAESLLSFTQVEFETGGRSQIDFLRSKANLTTAKARTRSALSQYQSALARLQSELGTNQEPFEVDMDRDRILASKLFALPGEASATAGDAFDLQRSKAQRVVVDNVLSYQKKAFLPSFSLVASLQNRVSKVDSPNRDFDDLLLGDRMSASVGVAFEWLIFDGFGRSSAVRQARADAATFQSELNLAEREQKIARRESRDRIAVTELEYTAALEQLKAGKLAYEQSESNFRSGLESLTDLLEFEEALRQAELSVFQALGDRLDAVVQYRWVRGWSLSGADVNEL